MILTISAVIAPQTLTEETDRQTKNPQISSVSTSCFWCLVLSSRHRILSIQMVMGSENEFWCSLVVQILWKKHHSKLEIGLSRLILVLEFPRLFWWNIEGLYSTILSPIVTIFAWMHPAWPGDEGRWGWNVWNCTWVWINTLILLHTMYAQQVHMMQKCFCPCRNWIQGIYTARLLTNEIASIKSHKEKLFQMQKWAQANTYVHRLD